MTDGQDTQGAVAHSETASVYVLQAQEEERYRLAREIHDGPAQVISNAIFSLELCERLIERDSEALKREIVRLRDDLRNSLEEIRHFIFDLRPPTLLELGLSETVERYVQDFGARYRIQVELRNFTKLEGHIPTMVEVAIFRIVQEAMQNVRRHSSASRVVVTIDRDGDFLSLTVEDDGEGFDPQEVQSRVSTNWGLVGMRERAELIKGELELQSEPGNGTKVLLKVPLGEEK